ncbi:MAG: c-type cytochrome [Thiotrichales bacterium]|jgi:cytochrome c553|nr:c-type cytochrome [Thiotrichales bacterium]MBT3614201.1 c-type cytochrome [Thiotrichales bacterium]MBT3752019.1 c-type cytochrome [Thiotrichales bacterium]MBT3837402.1 c-type cytochrome [Thiotrichales bacterium]MBT4574020.1 c-type cytochrome [Thiotrichales bacterium]
MKKNINTIANTVANTVIAVAALTVSISATAGDAAGDAAAGKARAAVCGACHGANGEGNPAFPDPMNPGKMKAVPALAGQNAGYFSKQIQDFKSGSRKDVLMTGQAMALNDSDIANLGAHYSTIASPDGVSVDADLAAKGKKLFQAGDAERKLTACMACHGPKAAGNGPAKWPGLTGQLNGYTVAQLNAFRSGARSNDPSKMMRDVAKRLTDGDIDAVTAYLQSIDGVAIVTAPKAAPAPVAEAVVAATVASSVAADGAALFQASCFACHGPAAPALKAPQIAVKADWEPRLAKVGDRDGLVKSAMVGIAGTAMAAKGGSSLTEAEIGAVVDYMLAQAGL